MVISAGWNRMGSPHCTRQEREHQTQLLRPRDKREILSFRWENKLGSLSIAPFLSQINKQQIEAWGTRMAQAKGLGWHTSSPSFSQEKAFPGRYGWNRFSQKRRRWEMVFHSLKTVMKLCCLSLLKKIRNLPQSDFSFAEIMLSFFVWLVL